MAKAALFTVLLSVLSGCAFDEHLEMPIDGLETPVSGGSNRKISLVIPFSDLRSSTERCGMKKNGFNMDVADAICKTTPGQWMSELLANELRASGFTVIEQAKPLNENTLVIEGAVSKVFVELVLGGWSSSAETDLEVMLVAKTGSGLKAERNFFSKGIKKGIVSGWQIPSAYRTSLKRAADDLLEDMVQAIFYLMNIYPQLGVGEPNTDAVQVFDELSRP